MRYPKPKKGLYLPDDKNADGIKTGKEQAAYSLSVKPQAPPALPYHFSAQLVTVGERQLPVATVKTGEEAARAFVKPLDLARLAVAGLKARARSMQEQAQGVGREAVAYSRQRNKGWTEFYDYETSDERSPAGSTFADAHLPKEGAASEPYLPKVGGSVSSAGHAVSVAKLLSCVKEEHS